LGILGLETALGSGVEEEKQKKTKKNRAFKLRRGGSAAITRRPPRRNPLRPPFSIGEEDEREESLSF